MVRSVGAYQSTADKLLSLPLHERIPQDGQYSVPPFAIRQPKGTRAMLDQATEDCAAMHEPAIPADRLTGLQHAIEHAAHLLPAQGPITAFVHHNTLHAFEDTTFAEAVKVGLKVFGCQPYLAEEQYRDRLNSGRIRLDDITAVLLDDMDDRADGLIGSLGTRFHLRLAMLQYPMRVAPGVELRWLVAETDALRRYRKDAPRESRERAIEDTRRWVMRDLRNGMADQDHRIRNMIASLFDRFGKAAIEQWSDAAWESFSDPSVFANYICCKHRIPISASSSI
jgi:hypothetical protein